MPDCPGDLQPAQKLSPGPRLQTHPCARLQRSQGGGKDMSACVYLRVYKLTAVQSRDYDDLHDGEPTQTNSHIITNMQSREAETDSGSFSS